MSNQEEAIARLLDENAIRNVLRQYARGVDRQDWDLVRSTYHVDATDDHSDYKGNIDGFIEWLQRRHPTIEQSFHFLGNCMIEFANPDLALVETYYLAMARLDGSAAETRTMLLKSEAGPDGVTLDVTVSGRYVDRFERRDGAWRIARRTVVPEKIKSEVVKTQDRNPAWPWAKRDKTDTLYSYHADIFGT